MTTLLASILCLIFLFISLIHFYWGFGGRLGSQGVFPTKDADQQQEMPGPLPTFIVAVGLACMALFVLIRSHLLNVNLPSWIEQYGLWILAGIFILRAIGDFKYAGFFRKIKNTPFGRNDTRYYSPLCLLIGVLTLLLQVLSK